MDVVDQIEEVEDEIVVDLAVDHLVHENLLVHTMFATNVEVQKKTSSKISSVISKFQIVVITHMIVKFV
jgi:hypothetical protein